MSRPRLSNLWRTPAERTPSRQRARRCARRGPLSLALEPLEDRCLMSVSPMGEKSLWDEAEYLAPLGFDAEVAPEELQASFLGFDSDTTAYFKDVDGPLGDVTPTGTSYLLFEHWGGTWSDAEKSPTNTEDDLMCWAAASSNVLAWTGWGQVGGMTNADQMFAYYQNHWTDEGGTMAFAWNWWFDGLNPQAAAKVATALLRIENSNFSNAVSVGSGVFEYKIDYGPGYRVYFG